jgi:hypothetical protein
VLSIRDKPELGSLAFKPAAATSTPLRARIGAGAKTGVGEDATDADATAFAQLLHQSEALWLSKTTMPVPEMLLLQLLLQLHAAHGLQLLQKSNPN